MSNNLLAPTPDYNATAQNELDQLQADNLQYIQDTEDNATKQAREALRQRYWVDVHEAGKRNDKNAYPIYNAACKIAAYKIRKVYSQIANTSMYNNLINIAINNGNKNITYEHDMIMNNGMDIIQAAAMALVECYQQCIMIPSYSLYSDEYLHRPIQYDEYKHLLDFDNDDDDSIQAVIDYIETNGDNPTFFTSINAFCDYKSTYHMYIFTPCIVYNNGIPHLTTPFRMAANAISREIYMLKNRRGRRIVTTENIEIAAVYSVDKFGEKHEIIPATTKRMNKDTAYPIAIDSLTSNLYAAIAGDTHSLDRHNYYNAMHSRDAEYSDDMAVYSECLRHCTDRQAQILHLFYKANTYESIGDKLGISTSTVCNTIAAISRKLGKHKFDILSKCGLSDFAHNKATDED